MGRNGSSSIVLTDVNNWKIATVITDLFHHPSKGPSFIFDKNGGIRYYIKREKAIKSKRS